MIGCGSDEVLYAAGREVRTGTPASDRMNLCLWGSCCPTLSPKERAKVWGTVEVFQVIGNKGLDKAAGLRRSRGDGELASSRASIEIEGISGGLLANRP